MHNIMFSQNENEFVLISTLKIIVLFKYSEWDFTLKPRRNQAWSHHMNICVVWTICTVGQSLNFLLQWPFILLLPWPVQKSRKRKCDSRIQDVNTRQLKTSAPPSHQKEAEEEEVVGNWDFLRLLPQSTSRNVENQSARHPRAVKIRLLIDQGLIYHRTQGILLHLKPADNSSENICAHQQRLSPWRADQTCAVWVHPLVSALR